jgi:hypothetical protein
MTKKHRLLIFKALIIAAFILGLFLIWEKRSTFKISTPESLKDSKVDVPVVETAGPKSPISGLACANAERRPLAVMLEEDAVARPLSGIGEADLVVEMQVVQGSMTRMMPVFICATPAQIGAVRSARDDYIPLAAGLDAIYAHWGGSHFALDELKTGVIDDIDALTNPYSAFYRTSDIAAPHNGFTSISRLIYAAQKLGLRTTGKFIGYPHLSGQEVTSHGQEKKTLRVGYSPPFNVGYEYSPDDNSYLRYRANSKEIDKNTGAQVEAKNVIIMRAVSEPLEGQYNDVHVEGGGKAEYYLNGKVQTGTWKKDKSDLAAKLYFYDDKGQEIKFVPGSIWVEIVDPDSSVTWQ